MQIFPVFFVICIAFAIFFGGETGGKPLFLLFGGAPPNNKRIPNKSKIIAFLFGHYTVLFQQILSNMAIYYLTIYYLTIAKHKLVFACCNGSLIQTYVHYNYVLWNL